MAGRTTKCTPEVIKACADAIAEGASIEGACLLSGISVSTYYNWRARGEEGEEPFTAFLEAVKGSETVIESRLVEMILDVVPDKWQAGAWFLERRFPERWGRRTMHEHSGGDKPVEVKTTGTVTVDHTATGHLKTWQSMYEAGLLPSPPPDTAPDDE